MDTLQAYMNNKRAINENKAHKYMDFHKLWELIHTKKPEEVYIYLQDDEEWTSGHIIKNHEWNIDLYYFVHSNWATPAATFFYDDGSEEVFQLCTLQQQYNIEYYEGDGEIPLCRLYELYLKPSDD